MRAKTFNCAGGSGLAIEPLNKETKASMSLSFEHSDLFLDTLIHSREQLRSEQSDNLPSVSPRRRRTKSTAFEEPKTPRGFLSDWRSKSYGQDVAKLPEKLVKRQETFTSIPEGAVENEER